MSKTEKDNILRKRFFPNDSSWKKERERDKLRDLEEEEENSLLEKDNEIGGEG